MQTMYHGNLLGKNKPNDILQEVLPNVMAGHVVQSYIGSYGAMIHPVGACATTAVSVEEGVDKIRLGKAEFYSVVEGFPEIADSLVLHLDRDDQLLLFVVLAEGAQLDDDLRARVSRALRTNLSPRHVPDRIVAVPAVPRTLSGKKLEMPVKRILSGTPVEVAASQGALMDPESLRFFAEFAVDKD